jgi:predicted RNase H-like nuclease (RuvC/YqgF family)
MENFREKRLERQVKSQQNTTIVISVILFLSIIGNIFLFIRNNRIGNEREELVMENEFLAQERESAEQANLQLEEEVEQLNTQISQIRDEATNLEAQIRTRDTRIANLRRQVTEVEGLREEVARIETLEEEIERLEQERDDMLAQLDALNDELETLWNEHEALTRQVDEVSHFTVHNITVNHIRDRWLGRPVILERARRINRTEITLAVDGNIFVEPGMVDVYLVMLDPEGNVINPSEEPFTVNETDDTMPYTDHLEIEYQHRSVPMEFTVNHEERLESGTYTVEVYLDGELTGWKEFDLE